MNRHHLLCRGLFLLALTILLAGGLASCSTNDSNIDLSQYLGENLSDVESALDIQFTDMSQYRGFENTYRAEKRDGKFDCVIDSTGKVIRIHILSSGKNGYSVFGVTSDMNAEAANEILARSGISYVLDAVWCCSNKTDAIIQEGLGWSLEKDSAILEDALFRVLVEENFTYQYDDSVGAYYIGNGQVVEYLYDSFPQFVYDYESLSAYQQSSISETLDGRYIVVSGTITGISPDGKVTVLCEDEDAGKAAGLLLPMVGFAEIYLTPEQEPLLGELSVDDTIFAFGRVDMSSYYSLICGIFRLDSSIVLSVDGEYLAVPFIQTNYPGLTTFNEDGSISTLLPDADVEYIQCTVNELLEERAANPLRANQKYHDQYIELTGTIVEIDSNGKFFEIGPVNTTYAWESIVCNIQSEEVLAYILQTNVGDIITVKCRVIEVGSDSDYKVGVTGYSIVVGHEYFAVTLPDSWKGFFVGKPVYSARSDGYGFYEKFSYDEYQKDYEGPTGLLFSIELRVDGAAFTDYPGWKYVGILTTPEGFCYDIVFHCPTAVQWIEAGRENYEKMSNDIDAIMSTLVGRNGCVIELFED